jgi:NADH:ubiquinone reductase (H+-translocating)
MRHVFNHRLVNACIRANAQDEPVRPGQLHVAIIGAGATGTELAAELHRTVRQVVSFGLDHVDPAKDIRIILIEAAPRILPALPERISKATLELLKQRWAYSILHRWWTMQRNQIAAGTQSS